MTPDDLPEIEVDRLAPYFQPDHYALIVAVLRGMDIKSNVSFNGAIYGVQVTLEGTRAVVWSNYDGWAVSIVDLDGSVRGHKSNVPADVPPEVAAGGIAFFEYVPTEVGS